MIGRYSSELVHGPNGTGAFDKVNAIYEPVVRNGPTSRSKNGLRHRELNVPTKNQGIGITV